MGMAVSVPRFTVDQLDQFPDDGNRYELLDGVLLVTPLAGAPHQLIASRLAFILSSAVHQTGATVFTPGGIVFPPRTQLEPDILVVPAHFPPDAEWPEITEHWLAVEILSRSSRIYDREFKRQAYLDLGVHEVWLVDRHAGVVETSRAAGEVNVVREAITWRIPSGSVEVMVDLDVVFAGLR